MRKIFLFISAVLLSIAMQATVITKNFDLSGTSNYGTATVSGGSITGAAAWNGAQLWEWTEGALEYDQVVLEVADHDYTILLKVTYSGTPDIEQQIEMPASKNSVVLDIEHEIIKGIAVLNWSDNNDVAITVTGLYMRGAIGERKHENLWTGTKAFGEWDWSNRLSLEPALFSNLHVGDMIDIYFTKDAESYHQLQLKTEYNHHYPSFAPEDITLGGSSENGMLRFTLTNAADLTTITSDGGLYINGKYITFTRVAVVRHDVLWSGSQEVGEWSGGQSIAWSKLTDLKMGNILCVRVTAGEYVAEAYNQVFCSYKSDWTGVFSPSANYLFQEGDEMPMIVEIPVTYKMLKQLKGEQLNIGGKNYTMTDIFIKEGTPTTTVAEYLTVSAAGMATYVLPFDVPTLPAGVEAYTLTNSGDETIWADQVDALEADKPVLIVAAEGEYEFVSEAGASDDISGKTGTYANGALVGTYQAIAAVPQTEGGNYNYVLQQHGEEVAFYQVKSDDCALAAYRAYLSCGHNHSASGPASAPMRIAFRPNAPTGLEDVQTDNVQSTKILRNGQLFILRNGVEYNVNGQIVK